MTSKDYKKIVELRRKLHCYPDVSNWEEGTAKIISEFVLSYRPDEVYENLAGHGLMFKFHLGGPGKTVALRADLDALPIKEENQLEYVSRHQGVSHKCGHDGHMSLVCGVLEHLDELKKLFGNLLLIFQPAEETGEGAKRFIEEEAFKKQKIDAVFGLHNLPGHKEGQIVLCHKTFACSSVGMEVSLKGATSHAAEPELGRNPYVMLAELKPLLDDLNNFEDGENFRIATLTHAQIGSRNFGISPGEASACLTLRAAQDSALEGLKTELETFFHSRGSKLGVEVELNYQEYFPALANHQNVVEMMVEVCQANGLSFLEKERPFRWSEDFGFFTQKIPGAYFGLGAGKNSHPLHDASYDFNDEIIEKGVLFYKLLIQKILG